MYQKLLYIWGNKELIIRRVCFDLMTNLYPLRWRFLLITTQLMYCRFVNLQQSISADTKDAVNALVRKTPLSLLAI